MAYHLMTTWKTTWLCSLVLITSCATTPKTVDWNSRSEELKKADKVTLQARVVINRNGSVYHFTVSWQQTGDTFQVTGLDILGRQVFVVNGNQLHALVTYGDNQSSVLSREFLQQEFGVDADPRTFTSLLQAIETRFSTMLFVDSLPESQKLGALEVLYHSYQQSQGHTLPRKVSIKANGTVVKLAIYSWHHVWS